MTMPSASNMARTVSTGAGIRYAELALALDAAGFALHNLASLPHITVGGAIATATHGSGDRSGNLATAVTAIELVTSDGDLVCASRGDKDFAGPADPLGWAPGEVAFAEEHPA